MGAMAENWLNWMAATPCMAVESTVETRFAGSATDAAGERVRPGSVWETVWNRDEAAEAAVAGGERTVPSPDENWDSPPPGVSAAG